MRKSTKRYVISSLDNLNLSPPIRYERYYINDNLVGTVTLNIFASFIRTSTGGVR